MANPRFRPWSIVLLAGCLKYGHYSAVKSPAYMHAKARNHVEYQAAFRILTRGTIDIATILKAPTIYEALVRY